MRTNQLNNWLIDQLNLALQHVPSPWVMALAGFVLFAILSTARRAASFHRPGWLHRNTAIQLLGNCLSWLSFGALLAIFLISLMVGIAAFQAKVLARLWTLVAEPATALAAGATAGLLIGLAVRWFLIPQWEREEGLSFVDRDIAQQGTKRGFDPRPLFPTNGRAIFVGKDETDSPVTLSWAQFNSSHIPVVGATGSGKGVALQTLTCQAHRAGQTVVVFDPKPCEILPRVLVQEAVTSRRKFHYVDLRERKPQVNPLNGLTHDRLVDLLIEILELKKTGEPKSDHYREQAQKGIRRLAALVDKQQEPMTFQGLLALAQASSEIAESENLMTGLEKFARFDQFNTTEGLDLESATVRGDIIYIAGDGSSEDLATMQRALLSRYMQILADRLDTARPVCLVIDELADLLTGTVLSLLSKVRSRNTHALLAFQTPGNLRLARGVDPEGAFSICWGNTTIKIVYRLEELKFAEEISKRIGPKPTQVRTVTRDNTTKGTRESWTQSGRLKVESHDITNLPMPVSGSGQAAMGFLIGAGPSRCVYLGPIPIDRHASLPRPHCAIAAPSVGDPEEKI